jgi:hypothetical protein
MSQLILKIIVAKRYHFKARELYFAYSTYNMYATVINFELSCLLPALFSEWQ